MDKSSYLNIEVDDLFKNHTVHEIDNVLKQIQREIEQKREDLRALVGEKYRDLIQAADTIKEMNIAVLKIDDQIKNMVAESRNISQKQLPVLKLEKNIKIPSTIEYVAEQTMLLIELPDEIWECLDAEDFFKGTQLFILGQQIYAGLQLQCRGPDLENIIPLLLLHWNTLSNLKQIIIQLCNEKLQEVDLNSKVATSCLLSLYFLEDQSLVNLLNTFIKLHNDRNLENTLKFNLSADTNKGSLKNEIEQRTVNCLKLILKTVELIQVCFVENDGGTLVENLNALYGNESKPLISLVSRKREEFLPKSVTTYRLTTKESISPLSRSDVAKCVGDWLEWIKSYVNEKVGSLLGNISNITTLHRIQEEAIKVETPKDWPKICYQLTINDTNIWHSYFQPIFTKRYKEIVKIKLNRINDLFERELSDGIRMSCNENRASEADLNWFVWKDFIGETVIESRDKVIEVMSALIKGMWQQDHGISPNLLNLYQNIDTEFAKLLSDLEPCLSVATTPSDYDTYDESNTDQDEKQELKLYLKEMVVKCIERISKFIREISLQSSLEKNELEIKTSAIYAARFCQSFNQLLPNLRACVISDTRSDKTWKTLCDVMRECRNVCWLKWIALALEKVEENLPILPQEFSVEANIEYLLTQWDVIRINQKDEENQDIETSIKIPNGPSLKLHQYLYTVCRILDEAVPHTLPKTIHTTFIDKIIDVSLTHYQKVISENEMNINQKCALQLLVDIRFLTLMLVARENKKGMELSQSLCEKLRQKIDPFDYDVFYPHIQTNVKRSVQRVQTLYGSLITNGDQLSSVLGVKPIQSGGSGDKAPNLLTSCSQDGGGGQYFTLLPVIAPVLLQKKQDRLRKKSQLMVSPSRPTKSDIAEMMTSSLPLNLAQVRSGAAAFFGTDWFSGS